MFAKTLFRAHWFGPSLMPYYNFKSLDHEIRKQVYKNKIYDLPHIVIQDRGGIAVRNFPAISAIFRNFSAIFRNFWGAQFPPPLFKIVFPTVFLRLEVFQNH